MSRLPLFDSTIQERFEQFHQAHPEVLAYLVQLCYELRRRGRERYGIRGLWERARWHFHVERGEDEYVLNDHMHSRYARLIVQQHPDLAGFFEMRRLRAE